MMRVLQISPTYFSERSVLGGGERYPLALAKALRDRAQVQLISFGPQASSGELEGVPLHVYRASLLRGSILNPFNLSFLWELVQADILHCHQICTLVSDLTCLVGLFLGKRVFLTDHGGGAEVILHRRLPWIHRRARVILQSEFTRAHVPRSLQPEAVVIKGGVDTVRYRPDSSVSKDGSILFVGRILPHKGINYLIEAFRRLHREDLRLRIIGRVYHQKFYDDLQRSAEGLRVEFVHHATDEEIIRAYRQALMVILPSVHTDIYGDYCATTELMGFTLLEAQACGTPVICSTAGAMPEFVRPKVTGEIVRPNSADSLLEAVQFLLDLPAADFGRMAQECRQWALGFDWGKVAARHLELYQGS